MNKPDNPYNMMSKSFYGGGKVSRAAGMSQTSQYNDNQTSDRHTLSQSMLEVSNIVSEQKNHTSSRNIIGTNSLTRLDPINSRTAYGFGFKNTADSNQPNNKNKKVVETKYASQNLIADEHHHLDNSY